MAETVNPFRPARALRSWRSRPRASIDARDIEVKFKVEGGVVEAVKSVSFQLHKGETIALVGESGSGKSVTARTIMRLLTKRATVSPRTRIMLEGDDITKYTERRCAGSAATRSR